MSYKSLSLGSWLASAVLLTVSGNALVSGATLTAAQIVDKNIEARGGLKAWRAVQAVSFSGKVGAGGNQRSTLPAPVQAGGHHATQSLLQPRPAEEVQLPFVMELKRPRKVRFELQFAGQTAIQVFDGTNGWKLRPYLNRRVVEPYTPEEMMKASQQAELDGRLVDYAAKGTHVALDGTEKVEGRDTYNLKLTLKNGQVTHVWVDTETFLETKLQGTPRRLDGTDRQVEVYMRDYRTVDGLQIPFLLETRVLPVAKPAGGVVEAPFQPEKLVIESIKVNPKLEDTQFTKPEVQLASLTK